MEKKKFCVRCGQFKPIEDYNKKTASRDGKQPYCRQCQTEYNKSRNLSIDEKFTCFEIMPGVKVYKRKEL